MKYFQYETGQSGDGARFLRVMILIQLDKFFHAVVYIQNVHEEINAQRKDIITTKQGASKATIHQTLNSLAMFVKTDYRTERVKRSDQAYVDGEDPYVRHSNSYRGSTRICVVCYHKLQVILCNTS